MMRIGIQLPRFKWEGGTGSVRPRLAEIGGLIDESGFDSLWVMDHFFQIPGIGEAEDPMLEGYSALNYLAGITEHVKLGVLVTGIIYRHPGILVKTVTSLDVLSGGRAYFGLGAAWFEREAIGLGVGFPGVAERFERLEEGLKIAHQMWSGEAGPFNGKHYVLQESLCRPLPLQAPHPPILVGGMGERKTLKLVAKYADACNLFSRHGVEVVGAKLEVLKRHCDRLGRNYADIEKTTVQKLHLGPGAMKAAEVVSLCRHLAAIGVQHAIFDLPDVETKIPVELLRDEVLPEVKEL